jgi:hypothetical protein
MRENPWEDVLDELYQMGGRGEFPSDDTEQPLDDEANLVTRLGASQIEVEEAAKTLQKMDLAVSSTVGRADDDNPTRYELSLHGDGYDFAHNRQQEKRNIRSNRSVSLLTLVLAFVGMAQATALTANVSDNVTGNMAIVVTFGAGLILLAIYVHLLQSGYFDSDEL